MARLRVLTPQGDKSVVWEPVGVESGDPEALAAVHEAERIFHESRAAGGTAIKTAPGPHEVMDKFDPLAEEIVIVPRLVGG